MNALPEVKVPFIDLKQRFLEEKEELLACVERVLSEGTLVMTPELARFEGEVCDYTGAKHCIGVNSGTDALMMALWGLGIGKNDEVITTPISFIATTGAIMHVGAKPVYVDVGADQNIDTTKIEAAITPRTKAIMPVHWTGRSADMDAINAIAARHNLIVIEDSCQSMGAFYKGQHAGTLGHVGAISAHPLKALNAAGDGGLLLTNDDEVARKCRLFRNHGLLDRDTAAMFGVNSRLDVLQAEILSFRLKRLDDVIERRRRNANLYRQLIKTPKVFIPSDPDGETSSYVMFLALCENRDALKDHLRARGIESLVYYGRALHLHPAAEKLGYKKGDFPVAESQADKVLALPHHQNLNEEEVTYVAKAVNEFYGA
jgi:dTDP-4-amino-4,6-dideoxygalactose transaminase